MNDSNPTVEPSQSTAVINARIMRLRMKFGDAEKECLIVLEDRVGPRDVLSAIRHDPQGVNEWDTVAGQIYSQHRGARKLLAEWGTSFRSDNSISSPRAEVFIESAGRSRTVTVLETIDFA